jgi:DNA-binding LytR/AlgR family response regulator
MEEYVIIRTRDELVRVNTDRILYFEANRVRCKLLIQGGIQYMLGISLGKVDKLLDQQLKAKRSELVRVGKSYIINTKHLLQIHLLKQRVLMIDGEKVREVLITKTPLKPLKAVLEQELGLVSKVSSAKSIEGSEEEIEPTTTEEWLE